MTFSPPSRRPLSITEHEGESPDTTAQHRARGDPTMSIVAWVVLGLIAGFIGSKLVNKTGEGFILDIALGIVGAVVGGWLFRVFGMSGVAGVNIRSLIVLVVRGVARARA